MADDDRFNPLRGFATWPATTQEAFVTWLERASPRPGITELAYSAYDDLELWRVLPFVEAQGLLENLADVARAAIAQPQSSVVRSVTDEICKIPEQDRERFSQLVERAVRCHRLLELTIKTGSILWRQGRVFSGASSITQVRPVFEGEQELAVAGAAIVHEMQFEYFENGVKQSATVLFDDYRLELLKQAIARAQEKERILRSQSAPARIF